MIVSVNKVPVFAVCGVEVKFGEEKEIEVASDNGRDDLVVLVLVDCLNVTVRAKDLSAAIQNAMNTARY